MPSRRPLASRGFTLIELLVVVVLLGVIASVVGAGVLSSARRSRASGAGARLVSLQQPAVHLTARRGTSPTSPPHVERLDLDVALASDPVIRGVSVEARFDARVSARYRLRQVDPQGDVVRVQFPFPRGLTAARDVSLRYGIEGAPLALAQGAVYSPQGLVWEVLHPWGGPLDVVVSYAAQGTGALAFDLVGGARVGAVEAVVRLAPGTRPTVASDSLPPTSLTPSEIRWSYANLVAASPLMLDLPPSESPLGRAALLSRLAALAVAVFGLGLWYLAELRGPGTLEHFRWGHFLLLASNHVLFFVSFAVLGLWLHPAVAFALAAAPSLGLLTLHVARVTDRAFALTRALPLAVLSFVVVTAAVYAPSQRLLLALVTVVGAAAGVTLTWGRWSANRALGDARRELELQVELRAMKLKHVFDALASARATAAIASEQATMALERSPARGGLARELCEDALAALRSDLAAESAAREARAALEADRASERADEARALEARVKALTANLTAGATSLGARVEALSHAASGARPHDPVGARCASCGAALSPEHAHCPSCGVAAALRVPCPSCDHVWTLPAALLRRDHEKRALHCARCGVKLRPTA